jgi:hypothetical protein
MFSLANALLVFGLFLMGIGWRMRSAAIERRSSWQHANGVVVEVVAVQPQSTDAGSGVMFAPVVEFVNDATNKSIRFEDPLATVPATHKVGDVVDVLFNPSKPSQACIYTETRMFAPAAIFFGTGAALFLFAIFGEFQ